MSNKRYASKKSALFGFLILFSVVLMAVAPLLAREDDTAVAQDPDFSEVDDPLNGEYELFTVDDLLIMRTKEDSQGRAQVNNYIMETANFKVSNQFRRQVISQTCYLADSRQAQRTRIGRFFNLEYDVIATLTTNSSATGGDCSGPNNMALWVQDTPNNLKKGTVFSLDDAHRTAMAMDDFNLDGFDDVVILSNSGMMAATAVDVNDPDQGMAVGQLTAFSDSDFAPWSDPATGDLNADGIKEVAWIGYDYTVHFASVCPGSISGTVCDGKNAFDLVLDPLQSQTNPLKVRKNDPFQPMRSGCNNAYALSIGDFTDHKGDGLVVFDCRAPGTGRNGIIYVLWYQFDGEFNSNEVARIGQQNPITDQQLVQNNSFVQAARLDWLGNHDQLIYAVGGARIVNDPTCNGLLLQYRIGVLLFEDEKINNFGTVGSQGACVENAQGPMLNGMAVGRFAAVDENPSNSSAFNQQIATLLNDGTIQIFEVSPPASFMPVFRGQSQVNGSLAINWKSPPSANAIPSDPDILNWLVSGDLQGRSARLGPPNVIRLSSHTQPSVILGAPPMHIDYILPDLTTSQTADVVNFTAVPSHFFSQYTMSRSASNQSSDTNKTSYSFTTVEKSESSFSLKPPYLPNISGSMTSATTDKSEDIASTYAFTEDEFRYDASTTTGFGDQIWYSFSSFNLYVYNVLGHTVCPADNSDCTAEEEQPLYVMFSGPNSSGTGPASGATTEWYQPVHEPGNIFSYPWNQSQLQKRIGDFHLLTGPQSFFTDDSTQTQNLNWAQGGGEDISTGTVNNLSFENGYSLTGGKAIGKFLDVNLKGDINYNESTSVETLNKSTSTVGASQGIAISKPGSFRSFSLYQYRVEPYIFGRVPPPQTVDKPDLDTSVQTFGPLQSAFAADPTAPGSGAWWSTSDNPYNRSIDVALNHPVRWSVNPSGSGLNCLGSDCLTFNDPLPNNLWTSQFYWMRGLFVTVNSSNGPQRDQATAGDIVYLTARVYNYSLMDMPAGSKIKARFYRQKLDGTIPQGDSVLIAETEIAPLPGFNSFSAPNTPNWTTTTTSFDTTGLGNSTHIFWVLVWAEDAGGNLIGEVPGHGLSAKPGTLNTIGDVPLEMVSLDGQQRTFSNNVGYLHSRFYIAPADAQGNRSADPVLTILNARVTPAETSPGERVIVSADILSEVAAADEVHVQFFPNAAAWQAYQQDSSLPAPLAFDVEMLPHIDVGETDHLEIPYRTAVCGTQNILIVARADPDAEPVTATATYSNGPCLTYFPVLGGR